MVKVSGIVKMIYPVLQEKNYTKKNEVITKKHEGLKRHPYYAC